MEGTEQLEESSFLHRVSPGLKLRQQSCLAGSVTACQHLFPSLSFFFMDFICSRIWYLMDKRDNNPHRIFLPYSTLYYLLKILFILCVSVLHLCLCTTCVPDVRGSQNRVSDTLEIELTDGCESPFGHWESNGLTTSHISSPYLLT